MTYPARIKIDLSKLSNDKLSTASGLIKNELTDNAADFPALPVDLITLGGYVDAYNTIHLAPVYYGKGIDLKAARKTLLTALKKNGKYINELADGDKVLLGKCGYPFVKPRFPVGALAKAVFKNITSITHGFEIELEKVAGARTYIVCALPSAAVTDTNYTKWPWHAFAKTKGRITGLDSSVKYTLVAVAIGTHPSLTFSEPVERTTQ